MRYGLILTESTKKQRLKNVVVEWTKPRLLDKNNWIDKNWYDGQLHNTGLYYILRQYGSSKKILYIGQSSDSFFNRLIAHQEYWMNDTKGKVFISLGYIIYPTRKTKHEMKYLIEDVESALIYETQPEYNNKKTVSYTPKHIYIIKNTRFRKPLNEIISMRTHINN